jgi:(2R)-sulfolactate sulfo-lyase subunit beta
VPLTDLWVSTKCGESDTTTGLSSCPTVGNMYDKLLPHGPLRRLRRDLRDHRRRAHLQGSAPRSGVGEKFMKTFQAYQDEVIEPFKTSDLSDSQPTKGNILGGLTTIEEKALGNLEKIGRDLELHRRARARPRRRPRARASTSWTRPRRRPNA